MGGVGRHRKGERSVEDEDETEAKRRRLLPGPGNSGAEDSGTGNTSGDAESGSSGRLLGPGKPNVSDEGPDTAA